MTERPILFSGPMVRAILEGRKTQTRRVVTPSYHDRAMLLDKPCPYGAAGDSLYVREAFRLDKKHDDRSPREAVEYARHRGWPLVVQLEATDERQYLSGLPEPGRVLWDPGRLRPSIHMLRTQSRIDLEITGIRVERLTDISDSDALAEGCSGRDREPVDEGGTIYCMKGRSSAPSPRAHFMVLWDRINAKRGFSWASNPWVWVVSFRRVKP